MVKSRAATQPLFFIVKFYFLFTNSEKCPKVTSSNVSFCPTKNDKSKDIQLTMLQNQRRAEISLIGEAGTKGWLEFLLKLFMQLIDYQNSCLIIP